ncbi:MAG: hypothetical protein IT578_02455 [Verrucomicrobiae bacterium]|nr:hypothetical protein [Verrucomicrobiae bacterium]
MNHVMEHCGNFSTEVLEGLIGYGRERDKGRGKLNAAPDLPRGDGYASKEADLMLGGFLQRQAAQRAARSGQSLAELSLPQRERLACQLAREHLASHGPAAHEHYGHWMTRLRTFARQRQVALPPQGQRESDHQYARRLRAWAKERGDAWPELRRAAGIHLVFSPDPRIWPALRAAGRDERYCLRTILAQTMKEFSDWRRKQLGPGHSLGWVAGTHVVANGADRHPHIHVVILKRDEVGREVNCSVANLKGHLGREASDPVRELKRLFGKSVERELERALGPSAVRELDKMPSAKSPPPLPAIPRERGRIDPRLRHLARGLREALAATRSAHGRSHDPWNPAVELGSTIRLAALVSKTVSSRKPVRSPAPDLSLSSISQRIRNHLHRPARGKGRSSPGPEIGG